jgi:hypothetical protein
VRDPALAADIRAVARRLETKGRAAPMLGFPRERWWEDAPPAAADLRAVDEEQ